MLSPAQVVPFLQQQDPLLRKLAERYLTQAHDPSPATADDAWRMIDRFGKDQRVVFPYELISQLPQTESALDRVLKELSSEKDEDRKNYLEEALVKVPFGLLMRFRDRIEDASGLSEYFRAHLAKRFELATTPPQELWDRLMNFAQETSENWNVLDEYDPRVSGLLIEALARNPESAQWAIATLNDQTTNDFGKIFSVELLGQLRHRPATDLVADELISDIESDFLLESSTDALIRIGGIAVVQAIQQRWKQMDGGFKLYASDVLSGVKLPEAEKALIEYLHEETDQSTRTKLAVALCESATNDLKALEMLRQMVSGGKWDMTMVNLDEDVVALFDMVGHDVPELPQWRARVKDTKGMLRRQIQAYDQLIGDHKHEINQLNARLAKGQKGGLPTWQEEDELAPPSPVAEIVQPIRREAPKVGRNDPCPCGSGKKYKKCCGK